MRNLVLFSKPRHAPTQTRFVFDHNLSNSNLRLGTIDF